MKSARRGRLGERAIRAGARPRRLVHSARVAGRRPLRGARARAVRSAARLDANRRSSIVLVLLLVERLVPLRRPRRGAQPALGVWRKRRR